MNRRFKTSLACLAYSLIAKVSALALNEPSDGSFYLGAWVDTSVAGGDSPSQFNQRMGLNASVFQLSQNIPLIPFNATTGLGGQANASLIEETGTNALIFLTVYPSYTDFTLITSDDYTALGTQIATWMAAPYNRQVFLRFAPEMNSPYQTYGMQPTEFVTAWKTMYSAVKALAPNVAIVWSPYVSEGYPYGVVLGNIVSSADQSALDTTKDNQLNALDDAYAPYYPGDSYVDWNGISYYYLGMQQPFDQNVAELAGTVGGGVTGISELNLNRGLTGITYTEFYNSYCASKSIPCALSECGAAWHANTTVTPTNAASQTALQSAWYSDAITNSTFLSTFSKIKLFNLYEFEVVQDSFYDLRDYRLSWDSDVRSGFLSAFSGVSGSYLLAVGTSVPTSLAGTEPQNSGITTGSASVSYLPTQTVSSNIFSAARKEFGVWRWTVVLGGVTMGFMFGIRL